MLWGCEAGALVDTEFHPGAIRRKAVDECAAYSPFFEKMCVEAGLVLTLWIPRRLELGLRGHKGQGG